MAREALLRQLTERVGSLPADRVRLVAVDGVDGAGKTVFADAFAAALRADGLAGHRVSQDDFHRPRSARYARGRHSPVGFFLDSFDTGRLRALVLDPLRRPGELSYCPAAFDLAADRAVPPVWRSVRPGDAVVVDGLFLHRAELAGYWDLSVYLEVPFPVSVARLAARDGGSPDPQAAANRRYVEGQRLYLATCRPRQRATVVVDNSDPAAPVLLGAGRPGAAGPARECAAG